MIMKYLLITIIAFSNAKAEIKFGLLNGIIELTAENHIFDEILWKYQDDKIVEYEKKGKPRYYGEYAERTSLYQENGTLIIKKLRYQDSGHYKAELLTGAKLNELIYNVQVIGPVTQASVTCNASDTTAILQCTGETSPYTEYRWEGSKMQLLSPRMLLINTEDCQDTEYICIVSNPLSEKRSEPFPAKKCFKQCSSNAAMIAGGIVGMLLISLVFGIFGFLLCKILKKGRPRYQNVLTREITEIPNNLEESTIIIQGDQEEKKVENVHYEKGHVLKKAEFFDKRNQDDAKPKINEAQEDLEEADTDTGGSANITQKDQEERIQVTQDEKDEKTELTQGDMEEETAENTQHEKGHVLKKAEFFDKWNQDDSKTKINEAQEDLKEADTDTGGSANITQKDKEERTQVRQDEKDEKTELTQGDIEEKTVANAQHGKGQVLKKAEFFDKWNQEDSKPKINEAQEDLEEADTDTGESANITQKDQEERTQVRQDEKDENKELTANL
ncbi:hepatic and glial cell adhesion molecule-like isoform X1 [Lepisosteus oculatus]|uniref:hepatic and glial cell adhesion molecule-like isoform X1 n=1 Tax=Lepisosteus oculatus TaxID=7918 RepID=UPI0035F5200F